MIKFSTRRNLIYVLFVLIFFTTRKIIFILISSIFQFTNSILFTVLLFLSEILTGLIIYIYHKYSLPEKTKFNNQILKYKKIKVGIDNKWKVYSLLIMIGFFDFIEFKISVLYLPKITDFSSSLEERLCGLIIVICSLIYFYILKYPIYSINSVRY